MKLVLVLITSLATAGCAKKQQAAKAPAATPVEKKADEKPASEAAPAPGSNTMQGDPCEGGEATKH